MQKANMEEFASETDADYTSYWRNWVSVYFFVLALSLAPGVVEGLP